MDESNPAREVVIVILWIYYDDPEEGHET